jgi:hypothetical protein
MRELQQRQSGVTGLWATGFQSEQNVVSALPKKAELLPYSTVVTIPYAPVCLTFRNCVMPAQCICGFRMVLTVNSDSFPETAF